VSDSSFLSEEAEYFCYLFSLKIGDHHLFMNEEKFIEETKHNSVISGKPNIWQ
jgi:hypothetical protein